VGGHTNIAPKALIGFHRRVGVGTTLPKPRHASRSALCRPCVTSRRSGTCSPWPGPPLLNPPRPRRHPAHPRRRSALAHVWGEKRRCQRGLSTQTQQACHFWAARRRCWSQHAPHGPQTLSLWGLRPPSRPESGTACALRKHPSFKTVTWLTDPDLQRPLPPSPTRALFSPDGIAGPFSFRYPARLACQAAGRESVIRHQS